MSGRRVLLDDHDPWLAGDGDVRFRLTYEGPLPATQRDPINGQVDRRADVKHQIRQTFHRQLKRLWAVDPNLNGSVTQDVIVDSPDQVPGSVDDLGSLYSLFGWNFVPLVTEPLSLLCSLDILFLRPVEPGSAGWAGDIDNRLKTLFDAMKIPDAHERYGDRTPDVGERPMFCLLEDDKLITKIAVETDQMLQPVGGADFSAGDVRLVINVELRPYFVRFNNLHFA